MSDTAQKRQGLRLFSGKMDGPVSEHPELIALTRSPAIEAYWRGVVRRWAEQAERDFLGDDAKSGNT